MTKKFKAKIANFLPLIIILLTTIFISYHSFTKSGMYQTHDSEFHIVRSLHFIQELNRGQIPVRMVPDAAYSYGYPIFQFFYPLPSYIVAVFQIIGFTTTLSWKIMQVLVTFLSLYTFYLWTKSSFDKKSALTATILFGTVPFRFLMLYVTGQIGGYFGLLFATVIGLGLQKLLRSDNKRVNKNGGIILSIGVAGIITSHLLSVIIFFLPLFGYTSWLLYKNYSLKKIKQLFLWTLLGVGLSAFYFFPFMLEKSWIRLGSRILIDYTDHWPTLKQLIYSPWGYGTSVKGTADTMSFQIGLSILAAWQISIFIIVFKKSKDNFGKILALVFFLLFLLMLPISSVVWKLFVPIQLIQFQWRILAATSLVGAWLAGWSISKLKGKLKWTAIILLLLISFYNIRNYTKPWIVNWKQDQDYINDEDLYNGSTDISWELMPVNAKKTAIKTPLTIAETSNDEIKIISRIKPKEGSTREIININVNKPGEVTLFIWDLPVWEVRVNGKVIEKMVSENGNIVVPVNKDSKVIQVVLKKTLLQTFSDVVSVFSIITLITLIALPNYRHYIDLRTNFK